MFSAKADALTMGSFGSLWMAGAYVSFLPFPSFILRSTDVCIQVTCSFFFYIELQCGDWLTVIVARIEYEYEFRYDLVMKNT